MSKDWKTGDRVQKSDWNSGKEVISTGAVTDVVTETREKKSYGSSYYGRNTQTTVTETFIKSIAVKWDDGQEQKDLSPWHVVPEDSALEREFRTKAEEVGKLIGEKLAIASAALDEAEAIAEEHGISFSSGISPLSQTYKAASAGEKWPGLEQDFMDQVTDSYGEYDGWQHSAVCY
jgi:hypothetical protein